MNNKNIITDSPFLAGLPREAAEALAGAVRVRVLRAKEHWARQGDPARAVAWLDSGLLRVFFETSDGSIIPYRLVWPNEISCYGLEAPTEYPASSIALTPVRYYSAPHEVIEPLLREVPGLAHALLCYLSRQEERLALWSTRLASLPVRGRVRLILARMAIDMGRPVEDGRLVDFAVTNSVLSEIAHVSRDEVGRAVRELLAEGVVERRPGRQLLVPDVERLLHRELAEMAERGGLLSRQR